MQSPCTEVLQSCSDTPGNFHRRCVRRRVNTLLALYMGANAKLNDLQHQESSRKIRRVAHPQQRINSSSQRLLCCSLAPPCVGHHIVDELLRERTQVLQAFALNVDAAHERKHVKAYVTALAD